MTSIEYKKGGRYRIAMFGAETGDTFVIPAGCRVESLVTKKIGTTAGNLSIGAEAI